MSHVWMNHVTHTNESCHTYEWVMSQMRMSHVTHMNESCHTYEWVMSHIQMSRVTHTNESRHTYEWVMSHIWMSHVTQLQELPHVWVSHVTYRNESYYTHELLLSRSCSTRDSHYLKEPPSCTHLQRLTKVDIFKSHCRSLLQKSRIKETIFCKSQLTTQLSMGWPRLVGSLKL